MATDTIRPLSESTGKRIADILDAFANGKTIATTDTIIPEMNSGSSTSLSYGESDNPSIHIPEKGDMLSLTWNGQTFTSIFGGEDVTFYFALESSSDPSSDYWASGYYDTDHGKEFRIDLNEHVEIYSETSNIIKLESTHTEEKKGILEIVEGLEAGSSSWVTIVPETLFENFESSANASVEYSVPTEEGGVYAVSIDGVEYGATAAFMQSDDPFLRIEKVAFGDGYKTDFTVDIQNGTEVSLYRSGYNSAINVTVSVKKLA